MSRRATRRPELIELARVTGEFEGTSLELIPMVGPFEPWAVRADDPHVGRRAAAAELERHGGHAANLADCIKKLEAGSYAAPHGGRVVALTIPMSFPLRLSFRSGFILDAMPGGRADAAPARAEARGVSSTRRPGAG